MSIVGIVVLHHDSEDTLRPLLGQLERFQNLRPAVEVLIVDNSDTTIAYLDALPPGVAVLHIPNEGYGKGMNHGIAYFRRRGAEVVVLLTHDMEISPDNLGGLLEALDKNKDVAILGPVLVDATSGRVWSAGGRLSRWLRRLDHRTFVPEEPISSVPWIDGACMVVRLSDLLVPFCEAYFLYFEDADFCLSNGGLQDKVAVATRVRAIQRPGMHGSNWLLARNRLLFLYRCGRFGTPTLQQAYLVATSVVLLLRGRVSDARIRITSLMSARKAISRTSVEDRRLCA